MKPYLKIKPVLLLLLILLFNNSLKAQVMLPAYQGVFSKKIVSSGVTSNGLDFDGVDDYVTVPSGVYFNGDLTIEAWVYPKSYSSWGRIIDFGNGAGNNIVFLAFSTGTTGYPNFRVENSQFQSTAQLPLNKWSHVAATLSGTSAIIYVDGVNAGSATLVAPSNVVRTNNLIGFSNWTVDDKSNVILDEVRIWNVARTQPQIQANMNSELLGTETGLKAYYPFNQGIAAGNNTAITTVTDKTANAINGTLTNFAKTGTTSNFVVGKVQTPLISNGLVLNLDAGNTASYSGSGTTWNDLSGNNNNGTFNGAVNFTTTNGVSFFNFTNTFVSAPIAKTASMTYSAWAKTSSPSDAMLFNTGNNGSGPDLFFWSNFLSWNVWDSGNSPFGFTTATIDANWHQYTVVNDASSTAKLYFDGALVGSTTYRSSTYTNNLFIGGAGNGADWCWKGGIATFQAYNRALIDTEVLQNYNAVKAKFGK